ncbi:MAG TPA: hypothetical protein VL403_03475 [Candidatus Kryptonia bacterium]|nr:hypothetical protein [Candidatus Kryptonia bacterium]
MAHRTVAALVAGWATLTVSAAYAQPLDRRIPDLFGGVLATSISPRDVTDAQRPRVADQFRALSAALAAARSQAPIPSASGAFHFSWNSQFDSYVRDDESLGSTLAERAQSLGEHVGTFNFSYTRIDFDTLEGNRLSHLSSTQSALSENFRQQLPIEDQIRTADDVLETRLDLAFGFDLFFFTVAYGVTDSIDVSLALSVDRARMRANADAIIHDQNGDGGTFFTVQQKGVIVGGTGDCSVDFRCAKDGFSASAFGTGDLFLRSKWHLADTRFADFAVAGVLTLPTGNADDFLGFHDVTFTPWLIASKSFGRISPHLNLGYSFRSGKDVSQAQWIAGADLLAFKWLTLAADFLGFHDDKRDGVNDNVLQSAVGFKVNPFGQFVVGGNFQFPLNRDGLRADVIYTGQVEYTF